MARRMVRPSHVGRELWGSLLFASQSCVSESCIGYSAWLRGHVEGPSLPLTMTGGVSGVGTRQAVGVRIWVTHPTLPYGTSHAY